MCGICGFTGSASETIITQMCDTLQHRGPDDSGFYIEPGQIALGMRRLSIIDVAGGHQPIYSENRGIVVVYNGEIYNFRALRADLEARGHHFATQTDTEIIVHGYEAYGFEIFTKLAGMFAAALWDKTAQRLILARDRMGIKPVYYTQLGENWIFASEIKAFTRFPGFEARLDLVGLDGFLTYQYVPAPRTLFKNVFKLPPGHLLVLEPGQPKPTIRQYWQFGFSPREAPRSEAEWIDGLATTLTEAVQSHLISDVPLGAFLSGGVDSSTIVALMARNASRPVKTFSIGFEAQTAKNELEHARIVAHHLGAEHHELIVTANMAKQLPQLIWHMDEPLGDPAALPTFFVSQLAKQSGVTVALSGEGADELFAGYPKYWQDRYAAWYQRLPRWTRQIVAESANRLALSERQRRLLAKLTPAGTSAERTLAWRKIGFPDHYRARLLTPAARQTMAHQADQLVLDQLGAAKPLTRLQAMLQLDTRSWLPDDLLMKVDRMSMAASVEARVPYLDNQVVALAQQIPDDLKLKGRTTKYVLKAVAQKVVPFAIAHRPKQGFELPLAEWLRGDLGAVFRETLTEGFMTRHDLFEKTYVDDLFQTHQSGQIDHGSRLWLLANLSLWFDRFRVAV